MFIGNTLAYNKLVKWIQEPLRDAILNTNCFMVIQGQSGCGKTYGITRAIEQCGKRICKLEDKDVKVSLTKMTSCDIVSQFMAETTQDKIVFIDDLEMHTSIDRCFMSSLMSLCGAIPSIKIVIAAVAFDAKWNVQITILSSINESDIIIFLRNQYPELKPARILDIVQSCRGNLGAAVHSAITEGSKKDDVPLVKDMYSHTNPAMIHTLMEIDAWLMPLRYHENVIHELKQRKGTQPVKTAIMMRLLRSLCEWDVMMTAAKRIQSADSQTTAMWYISSAIASCNCLERKKRADGVEDNFTKLFNTLSLRKKQKVTSYQSIFPWDNVSGFYREVIAKKFSERSISAKHGRNCKNPQTG